ncbi:uncharacterized protein LOC124370678, partial [Homalodisca vitripennis]|uniref:uncharacterized protein LOC124370678 n=1 Tax=Homalodisca vitripennis TaxID=197043 RepID=UPI001EEA12C1
MISKICTEENEYLGKGSGWTLRSLDGILLRFSKYRPLGGSSYIPLPHCIENKKAIIEIKNVVLTTDISLIVNVYGLNKHQEIYPLKVCDKENVNHFDLLLISNDQGNNHYCYINNFSRLIRSQVTKSTRKMLFCKRCFAHYSGPDKLQRLKNHKQNCKIHKPLIAKMPPLQNNDSPSILKFTNFYF